MRVASDEYFATMGIPLLRGRLFDARDQRGGHPVLVISAELARRYFPDEDPIGRVLQTGWGNGDPSGSFGGEVIGVVGDVRQSTMDQGLTPHMYMSATQWPLDGYDVVVRATHAVRRGGERGARAHCARWIPISRSEALAR